MNINILIVDDIEANLFSLESLLDELVIVDIEDASKFQKLNIIKSLNGEDALKIAMSKSIDLIILDIQMPEMNGFEVAKYLKLNRKTKDIPIVFLTAAFKSEEFITQGFEVGAIDYFTKPIEKYQLMNRVKLYVSLFMKTKQLDEVNQNLEIRINEELKKSMDREKIILEQCRMKQISEMIINVSHHWRQPLTVISTIASGILVNMELGIKADEKKTIEQLDTILLHTQKLSDTIGSFDSMNQKNEEKEFIFFEKEISNSIKLFKFIDNKKDVVLEDNIDMNKNSNIKFKMSDLSLLIFNIFTNSNESFIINDIEKPTITIDIEYVDTSLILRIKDNAGGIKEDNLSKIFDPYFTTKHQSQGTGMGLYNIFNMIVDTYNGSFKISNIENGVLNEITLPIIK